jgi:hypothetical protein
MWWLAPHGGHVIVVVITAPRRPVVVAAAGGHHHRRRQHRRWRHEQRLLLRAVGGDGRRLHLRLVDEVLLEEARHPEASHEVLELLAVDVASEVPGVLLHPRAPVVLDLVVGSAGEVLRDLGPPVSPPGVQLQDQKLLLHRDVAAAQVGAQVIQPPQTAALPGALQPCRHEEAVQPEIVDRCHQSGNELQYVRSTCASGKRVPPALAVRGDVVDEKQVLLHRPWPAAEARRRLVLAAAHLHHSSDVELLQPSASLLLWQRASSIDLMMS